MYTKGEYDLSGTIIGVVEREKILNGMKVEAGNVLIGIPTNGLQTNGFSLARKILFPKYSPEDFLPELGCTVADALLAVHPSFGKYVFPVLDKDLATGVSHITGGGIVGNTKRILRKENLALKIDWNAWDVLPIFKLIQKCGEIGDEEMRYVFNLGIGLIVCTRPENVDTVLDMLKETNARVIGEVIST